MLFRSLFFSALLIVASLGIGLSYLFYFKQKFSAEKSASRIGFLYKLSLNKYYFDENYDALKDQKFQDIEIKEVILRDWVVDEKIVRPSNKLVSHTGFLISARYIKY